MQNTPEQLEKLLKELENERNARQQVESELKAAQQAVMTTEKARQEFVSLVTHELRVPMTAIKGYSDLLIKGIMGPLNDMQGEVMGTIRANVERMARMVSDLSDINKIEGQRLKLEPEVVDLSEIVTQVSQTYTQQIEEKALTFTAPLPDNLPALWADRARVVQIVNNLINNACTYTPEGGVITVTGKQDQNMLQFSVQDNGIGILADEQIHIFEKFFRASDEETRQFPGNGLALHVTKLLVELQGGTLSFESKRGVGSTFHVTLPTAEV